MDLVKVNFRQSTANETPKKKSWTIPNATIHDAQRPGSLVTFNLSNLPKQITAELSIGCHLREKNQLFSIWPTHMNPKISDANPTLRGTPPKSGLLVSTSLWHQPIRRQLQSLSATNLYGNRNHHRDVSR